MVSGNNKLSKIAVIPAVFFSHSMGNRVCVDSAISFSADQR